MNTPFVLLQDEWVLVAPLGDYPHQLGIQRLTADGIAAMANRFNGFRARLGRLFGGVPMFEGHHDTDPERYPNGKSFAWVMELQNRADGLWAKLKWTDEGRDLVQKGQYKFLSPVWNARESGRENGRPIYIPESLLSLALTNLPNLPLPPLANQQDNMTTITELLELNNDATPDQICEAVTKLKNAKPPLVPPELQAQAERIATLENQLSTQNTALSTSQAELANSIARADAAQTRLIGMILDNAIRETRITPADREKWRTDFEKDLAAAETALANQQPALNTQSQTRELGNQKELLANETTRRAELVAFLAEKQAAGMDYDAAWSLAKKERADIFAGMTGH